MSASWGFVLADAGGAALAELSTASGRSIMFRRNRYAEAGCTLSHEDDAAGLLLGALSNTGLPRLRAFRKAVGASVAVERFNGVLVPFGEQAEETATLSPVFRSPLSVLNGDGSGRGRFVTAAGGLSYTATDAGAIGANLLATANAQGATGLVIGTVEATKLRDRTYPVGTNLGTALENLTSVLDGFDLEEVATSAGATLNIRAALGVTRSSARFEYGAGTLANCRGMSRTTEPPANTVFVVGANGLTSTYSDAASVAKYGAWYLKAEFLDVSEQATLDDKARALVRPFPVKTLSFVPELALDSCPKPFDDFGLGDTVPFFARRDALVEDSLVRVNGFTIVVDDNGFESVTVDDPSTPGEDAVLRASLTVEVTDG